MRSPTMSQAATSSTVPVERNVLFWLAFLLAFGLCGLVANALHDNQQQERQRELERAFNDGMQQGYVLCRAERH